MEFDEEMVEIDFFRKFCDLFNYIPINLSKYVIPDKQNFDLSIIPDNHHWFSDFKLSTIIFVFIGSNLFMF